MSLQKKENRRSIMINKLLTEINKYLHLQQTDIEKYPYIPKKSQYYLKPGINQEGYQTAEYLLEQIEYRVISIFKTLYLNYIAIIFAFDNCSNYATISKDALIAN